MQDIARNKPKCFIDVKPPSGRFLPRIKEAIREEASHIGYEVLDKAEIVSNDLPERSPAVSSAIVQADCVIVEITNLDADSLYELGFAAAIGKRVLGIASQDTDFPRLPAELMKHDILVYPTDTKDLEDFTQAVRDALLRFALSSELSKQAPSIMPPMPVFIDWEILKPRERENLCWELLVQMGFRRVEWGRELKEIDLVAELPRKDPDGFEFKELWLVSMGLHAPLEMIIDMALDKPDYLLHRMMRSSDFPDDRLLREYQSPITFLIIHFAKSPYGEQLDLFGERMERKIRRGPREPSVRVRIWDQDYLTSLMNRFPTLSYKYFSDEGRIRSEVRKSYEELYKENSNLLDRQVALTKQLEEEKNARIRAERDAVWKDISFSAAHKIGNPIFAIETNLDPLARRIREKRTDEALVVVGNIRSSIEKAKASVEQFKSLARAQEIKITATLLRPILEDSCRTAIGQGVECAIECPSDLAVSGDPDRLAECFDELVINAMKWFDKPQKKIEIFVAPAPPEFVPEFLDRSKGYLFVSVKDNGRGIPVAEKNRIFDAFVTNDEHGTGLGLALVRRILEGHGGGIIEMGEPGKGADFELYLPAVTGGKKHSAGSKGSTVAAKKKRKGK
jgi:signal transduction histidine kinase